MCVTNVERFWSLYIFSILHSRQNDCRAILVRTDVSQNWHIHFSIPSPAYVRFRIEKFKYLYIDKASVMSWTNVKHMSIARTMYVYNGPLHFTFRTKAKGLCRTTSHFLSRTSDILCRTTPLSLRICDVLCRTVTGSFYQIIIYSSGMFR